MIVMVTKAEMPALANELRRDSTAKLLDLGSMFSFTTLPSLQFVPSLAPPAFANSILSLANGLEERIALLGPALIANSTLDILRLGHNGINAITIGPIASALELNTTLSCLTLPGSLECPHSSVPLADVAQTIASVMPDSVLSQTPCARTHH